MRNAGSMMKYTTVLVMLLPWLVGCKKKSSELVQQDTAQLQSIRDTQYILLMADMGATDASGGVRLFQFVTCAIKPNASMSDVPRFATEGTLQGVYSESNDFSVVTETCTPTYIDASGESLTLRPVPAGEAQARAEVTESLLRREQARSDYEQGSHYIAGFGFGATFAALSEPVRNAIRSLLPAVGWLQNRFAVFAAQWGLSASLPAGGAHIFDKIEGEQDYLIVLPKDRAEPIRPHELTTEDWVGSGASAALGYGSARVVIGHLSQKGGPWGAIAGYLLLPFVVTVVLATRTNHAKDILESIQEIFQPAHPESHLQSPLRAKARSIPEVSRILGETLQLAGWTPLGRTYYYCVPSKTVGENPVCLPLASPH